jgi:hypothetical protein
MITSDDIENIAKLLLGLKPSGKSERDCALRAIAFWELNREATRFDHRSHRRIGNLAAAGKLDALERAMKQLLEVVDTLPLEAWQAIAAADDERNDHSRSIAREYASMVGRLTIADRADFDIDDRYEDEDFFVAATMAPCLQREVPKLLPVIRRAQEVLAEHPATSEKDPPRIKRQALAVTEFAGITYEEWTGTQVRVTYKDGKDTGPFIEFLTKLFIHIGINSAGEHPSVSAASQARAYIARRKAQSV